MPLYLVAVVVVTDEREQMLGLLAAVHGCQHCSSGSGVLFTAVLRFTAVSIAPRVLGISFKKS